MRKGGNTQAMADYNEAIRLLPSSPALFATGEGEAETQPSERQVGYRESQAARCFYLPMRASQASEIHLLAQLLMGLLVLMVGSARSGASTSQPCTHSRH